ncbi:serine/threonine protein kinase [Streptomyces sp. NBC_00576]|uniref:serine/threonine protein kinase n=1 Tax=Streptomyces sp. NBC_00576 TaxID=2903665 RepID=UPI002E823ECE|nr:tetratricopeptide repeat protein [Streptomyces sp. NBC_00576]WUB76406.1 protein kinase [Streptomyces sp. NBC_00576]
MTGDVSKGVSGEVPDSEWSFGPLVVAGQPTFLRAARVELPEENPDPTVLPTITLLERAVSRGIDPEELPLPPGQLLAGQYLLIRPLGYGGMGEVYLALDTKVDDREVAIKILHPEQAAVAAGALVRERRALVDLSHDDIIRVYNYGHHPEVGDFLVLQYVDGLTLEEVRARARLNPHEFGGARFHEFVLAYGLRILSALGHLHTDLPGKVYGDLKPDNVMHDGTATKIIDVGSVRATGLPGLTTRGFRAPTVGTNGECTGQDDLFSLGETLRRLSGLGTSPQDLARLGDLADLGTPDGSAAAATDEITAPAPRGLGLVSLARVLHRATRSEPNERFADAREMAEQLGGVFRELRSLRTGTETFEPSPLFLQSSYALDGALGSAPPLAHWAAPGALSPYAPPSPAEVAYRLPVPRPDRHDDHHAELSRLADAAPEALLQHTGDWQNSTEVHLLRCRLRLRTAGEAPDAAERELRAAEESVGPEHAPYDWRLDWHRGLLALARGQVADARHHFDRVYAAIPGEYAPKLALGYCAERLGRCREALTFYEAVRLRNPSLGSAAFGAARARLALGGERSREEAVRELDAVPQHSRHRTAARTAAVRIGVEHLRTAERSGELPERLREVLRRLALLFHAHGLTDEEARARMTLETWEAVQGALARGALDATELAALAADADPRLGLPPDEPGLRKDLSRLHVALAHQATRSAAPEDAAVAEVLLDRAYEVRPLAFRHRRDSPWPGKRLADWLRTAASAPSHRAPSASDGPLPP